MKLADTIRAEIDAAVAALGANAVPTDGAYELHDAAFEVDNTRRGIVETLDSMAQAVAQMRNKLSDDEPLRHWFADAAIRMSPVTLETKLHAQQSAYKALRRIVTDLARRLTPEEITERARKAAERAAREKAAADRAARKAAKLAKAVRS